MDERKLQKTYFYQQVASEIVDSIKQGTLKPGDRLPAEASIAKSFGVGRNAVREALKALAMAGLIYSKPAKGSFISQNALDLIRGYPGFQALEEQITLEELMEVRRMLEVEAAGLAAERATADGIDDLRGQLRILESNLQANQDWTDEGLRFHMVVARMSQNKLLVHLLESLADQLERSREIVSRASLDVGLQLEDHRRIFGAIASGDSKAASGAMSQHLGRVLEGLAKLKRSESADR